MACRKEKLLKLYQEAIVPEKPSESRSCASGAPAARKKRAGNAGNEFENYCRGLEAQMFRLQQKSNLQPEQTAASAVRDYCCGLEQQMSRLQQKIDQLQTQTAVREKERINLLNEVEALRWQVDYDKRLLLEIKNSRGWMLARLLHYFHGLATLKKETIKEAKNDLDDLLAREAAADGRARASTAAFFRYLLNGAAGAAKHLADPLPKLPESAPAESADDLPYGSVYQDEAVFSRFPEDLKTVVFYLPQYHTFPENDEWWGKGFTEWVNTRKAQPRFPGHYQPRTPHRDIGYYNLADLETMKKQAVLAKRHGIDYFCFYYYWFDGKKLMEKPLEQLIAHPEIPMPFCLCWANENWTRAWDGQQKSVLIQQNYSEENDEKFIRDLKKYITDPRYMRCNGKPVILVYHAKIMPDPDRTFAVWRKWCRKNGVGEIQIWSCRTFIKNLEFKKPAEVDREVEFPPHMVSELELFPASKFQAYKDDGFYYNYRKIIHDLQNGTMMADQSPYPFYRCAMLGWDNSCRRAAGYSVWQYFSLRNYHFWMRKNIEYTRKHFLPQERFLFINAWNEWAEGTYLEPDERYGYANINTTTRALCDLPALPEYHVLQPFAGEVPQPGKILVHLHAYYPDLMEEFADYLNRMPFAYDCVITTDSRQKSNGIRLALKDHPLTQCRKLQILVTPNCGRDVAPFFAACRKRIGQYDFIGHFHTKKSLTVNWGDEWRRYLLDQLLGSPESIKAIFRRFDREPALGLFFPEPYPAMRNYMNWEQNRRRCEDLLWQMKLKVSLPDRPFFPVGQMFWAKCKAIAPLFIPGVVEQNAFEKEDRQVSNTLAHATERLWTYVAQGCGYTTLAGVFPPRYPAAAQERVRRLALYVHYSADKTVSDVDWYLLQELKRSADVVFISNGPLTREMQRRLAPVVRKVILRENKGYDFGAWRDALARMELSGYEELILLNNSILGPFCSFEAIFSRMAQTECDFWGMSEFPENRNPRREEAKALPGGVIPRHVQSYFLVFKKNVFRSDAFRDFWRGVKDETSLPQVVANCETQLSRVLEKAGFKSGVYLQTASRLQDLDTVTPEYNAIYCRPQDFLVLGFPFLKKNVCYYMKQPEINETVHLISNFCKYPVQKINITAKTR